MQNVPKEKIKTFIQTCHVAADYGLLRCSSGNLSLRLDEKRLLITSSRCWMARLTAADISLCLISDGSLLAGRKPSVEIGFHAGILQARPDVNAVMHFQAPCATALACRESSGINYFVIPEIPFYIGHIARIPYLPPGSPALASTVTEAMQGHDLILLSNHGQVTVANTTDHVIQNAVFFELACEIILHSGEKAIPLPEQEIRNLLELRRCAKENKLMAPLDQE